MTALIAEICLLLAALICSIAKLPQIYKTFKRKSVEDISLLWIINGTIAIFLLEMGFLLSENYSFFYYNLIPLCTTIFLLIQILYYRK